MNNDKYFNEIESTIKSLEIKKKVRNYQENQDTLISYWSIGKLLVDAQGGEERAKYGKEVIKSWSIELSERYGKGYSYSDLQRYKKFYNLFPIVGSLSPQLTWTHIRYLLPIKNENKRNYYYNLAERRQTPRFFLEVFLCNIFIKKTEIIFNIFDKKFIFCVNVSGSFPTLSFFIDIFFIFWAAQISHV